MYGISYSLIYATSHPIIISFELEKRSLLSLHLLPVIMALWSNTVLLYECNCFFFLLLYWNLHTMYNYLYLSERTPYYLLFYYWVSLKKKKSVTKYILCYTKDPVVSHLPIAFPQHFQIFLQSKRHLRILLLTTSTTLNSGFINFISRGNNRDAKKPTLFLNKKKRHVSKEDRATWRFYTCRHRKDNIFTAAAKMQSAAAKCEV